MVLGWFSGRPWSRAAQRRNQLSPTSRTWRRFDKNRATLVATQRIRAPTALGPFQCGAALRWPHGAGCRSDPGVGRSGEVGGAPKAPRRALNIDCHWLHLHTRKEDKPSQEPAAKRGYGSPPGGRGCPWAPPAAIIWQGQGQRRPRVRQRVSSVRLHATLVSWRSSVSRAHPHLCCARRAGLTPSTTRARAPSPTPYRMVR